MRNEAYEEGDFVAVYRDEPESNVFVGSGVILEIHDIPDTFGRKFYTLYTKGQPILYDDGFYLFETLSKAAPL
jgi:hypothetical protein